MDTYDVALSDVPSPAESGWLVVSSARGAASPPAIRVKSIANDHFQSAMIAGTPTPATLRPLLTSRRPGVVIAIGGGSVIDAAKIISLASAHLDGPGWFERWLETGEVGVPSFSLPQIVAIPTLVGSGSEMTPFATVWQAQRKLSLEHPDLKPTAVIRTAQNLVGAPYSATLFAAADAMSHALEAIWSRNATVSSNLAAQRALTTLAHLLQYFRVNRPMPVLDTLFQISRDSGNAIADTRTALAHSISYSLTCEFGLPHGLASSFALPEIARFNIECGEARLLPAAQALGCSTGGLPHVIERLFESVGLNALARQYLPPNTVNRLSGPLLDGKRSANNCRAVTEHEARSLVGSAVVRIWS